MATQHEIELMDSATRAQQATELGLRGERMIINMGPSHPSTHGVLRLVVELDGEEIVDVWPDVGYLHRGDEKIAENMTYTQFIPYTDRLDYLAPLANNVVSNVPANSSSLIPILAERRAVPMALSVSLLSERSNASSAVVLICRAWLNSESAATQLTFGKLPCSVAKSFAGKNSNSMATLA